MHKLVFRLFFIVAVWVGCNKNTLEDALNSPDQVEKLDLIRQDIQKLPNEIGQMQNLTHLYLNKNKLSLLPKRFENLNKLELLNLNNNEFEQFPKEIVQLTSLKSLSLIDNQIDSIPENIRSLTKLRYLNLANNPISIENQKKIKTYLPNTHIIFEFEEQLRDANGYFNKAVKNYEEKNYKVAVHFCNKAIEIDNDKPEYFSLRGFLKCNLDNTEGGCKDLQKALKLGDKQARGFIKMYCK